MRWLLLAWALFTFNLSLTAQLVGTNQESVISLSDEERQWVVKHPIVRVGITPDWAPFSFYTEEGLPKGIDLEILRVIQERTGLKFEVVPTKSWDETLRLTKENRIDITTSTSRAPGREAFLNFTRPYYQAPIVVVTREHDLRFYRVSLLRKATIAMPKNHGTTKALMERVPTAHFILCDTSLDCFKLVSAGGADATVDNMLTTSRLLNDYPNLNLNISGVTDKTLLQRLAVRRDIPFLTSILDKGLSSISTNEMDDITARYLPSGLQATQRGAMWQRRWSKVVLSALIVTIGLLIWNRSISREIKARRKVEAELREINDSLQVFSYSISHDLRAPLRRIRSFATALMEDYKDRLDAEGMEYLARMDGAAARLDTLISDVLAYSQAARSGLPLHPIDLNTIIQQLIQEYPIEQQKYFHVDRGLPEVTGNVALLSQCVANLFNNAIKFVPKDREPEINVRAEQLSSTAKLWIEDNGIGIAEEDRERIFKMFERLDTRHYEGSGIGLAVVAKAVEKMGGRVGVEAEPGRGSRFWIELPLAEKHRQKEKQGAEGGSFHVVPKTT